MTTDAMPRHEDPHALDAEELVPKGRYLAVLVDKTITLAPLPALDAPAEDHVAILREALPPEGVLDGALAIGFGNGGGLHLYVYRGATPSREQLAKLNPWVLSWWSARIFAFGETRYEEDCGIFDLGHEPCVVRTTAAIGADFAASCAGKFIRYGRRADASALAARLKWAPRRPAVTLRTPRPTSTASSPA